jgi:hypothetical protein
VKARRAKGKPTSIIEVDAKGGRVTMLVMSLRHDAAVEVSMTPGEAKTLAATLVTYAGKVVSS